MGQLLRPSADGLIYHAINHSNNRDAVFARPAAEGGAEINEQTPFIPPFIPCGHSSLFCLQ